MLAEPDTNALSDFKKLAMLSYWETSLALTLSSPESGVIDTICGGAWSSCPPGGAPADAHAYTSKFVRGSGNAVRPDDVVPTLTPALEVSDRLRTYLAERKLSQNYWYTWFAELIVDRLWSDLN